MEKLNRIATIPEGDVTAQTTGFSRDGDRFSPEKDVILRVEAMRGYEHKVTKLSVNQLRFIIGGTSREVPEVLGLKKFKKCQKLSDLKVL